jgi:hypothetical protein
MNAADAARLEPGTIVTVPLGRKHHRQVAEVVSTGPLTTWGRGMKPAGATAETPLCVVAVDLGPGVGVRHFGNSLVEVA